MTENAEKLNSWTGSLKNNLLSYSKRKSFRYGLPFILFVVGGSFGLREWTQIRLMLQLVTRGLVLFLSKGLVITIQQGNAFFAPCHTKYQFSQVKGVSKEEAEKMGLHKTKEVTLEKAYEEIQKLDIDNWENKRGPRPWEMDDSKK